MGRVTNLLIIANVAVFLLVFSMPEQLLQATFDTFDFSAAKMLEAWRWVTTMFLHGSASHLFFNMIALYFFGRVLESDIGSRKFLLIYFLSGLVGSLVFALTSSAPAVGASGAIFGVMGASMFCQPKQLIRIYVLPLPLGLVAILFILAQVALAAVPLHASGIAYVAHIGGLVTGSLLMFYMEPKAAFKGFTMILVLLLILIVLWPLIGFVVGIGQFILSILDFIVGFILYNAANLLFSWVWV
ncbi:MAG: rhomboid family intramembrane serine protease [Candidatus Aenigmatarchaeota archaeon]|nr:MAG: rhomboid family intramembrane serine protease [Candidatus Aenigmarchaeota archaeon]